MNTTPTSPLGAADIQFANNPEPKCPCIILADRSGSMDGQPIAELNKGIGELKSNLVGDALASLRVELALVAFNSSVTVESDFCGPSEFNPPLLTAGGGTSLGAAIITGLEMLASRCAAYRSAGVSYYRPWMLLLTDAESTDEMAEASRRLKEAESLKRVSFFGVGVMSANMAKLAELSSRPPRHLEGLQFSEFFEWLSVNLSSVAVSRPGDQVALTPANWSTV